MKSKFALCFRTVVVEAEESCDSVSTEIVPEGNTENVPPSNRKSSSISGHKNGKLFRRNKGLAFKHFPGLFKAIVFHDPLKNIQEIELQLKSKGPIKQRKCFDVLENESGKPEIITESEIQPEESSSSASSTSESKRANTTSANDKLKSSSTLVSCFNMIVFVIFATVLLGRIRAIMLISIGLSAVHWRTGHFRRLLDRTKSETAAPGGKHDEIKPENLKI